MPIQGGIRFRKHQWGKETTLGTVVAATRVVPYRGSIKVNTNRTTPDVDTGSLDPALPSFAGATDVSASLTGKLAYDDMPYLWALLLKGGVTPTGGATGRIWTFTAASLTADSFESVTDEWTDDVTSDSIVGAGGVIDSLALSFGEDLAAWDVTATLAYAKATFGGAVTAIALDQTPEWVYGAHTTVYMDSVAGSIGITPLASAVHGMSFTVTANLDHKRYANGSNSAWNLAGFGRGPRDTEFKLTLAKTTATIAEAQTLDDIPVPTRYFNLATSSTELVPGGSTPYSSSTKFAAELIDREDGSIGNNTAIILTYRVKYDTTLTYAIKAVVTNALASL